MLATASSDGTFAMFDPTTGQSYSLSFAEFDQLLLEQAPLPIIETPEALEAECIALVTSLFQTKNVHPIKLDDKEIVPIEGASPGIEFFSFQNGHTLAVAENKRTYTSYTYITCVEMKEQMVIQDDSITAVLINTFDYAGIRTSAPGHESWHRDLYHMREILMEAVGLR
jgi:hypothetical protein